MSGNQVNPAAEASPQAPQNDNEEFKKKIEESKKLVSEAASAPPKRGRGRPPKPKAINNSQSDASPAPGGPTAPVPAPDISIYVKQPLMAISKIPAVNYQIPELALSDDEAQACAEALNQVVQAFVPDVSKMDPKTGAVIGAIAVFGSVGFQKYMIFQQKKKVEKSPEKDEIQSEIKEAQEYSGIEAGNYYSRTQAQATA